MIIILEVIVILSLVTVIGGFVYSATGHFRKFYHDILGWHQPAVNAVVKIHGPIVESYCEFCGKRIMQDSQGNWY